MRYKFKVKALKTFFGNRVWRKSKMRNGYKVGDYKHLNNYIKEFAPNQSFLDVGCMWGVNGGFSFFAEEVGAKEVKCIDVFGPTPEFLEEKKIRNSSVDFILGDACSNEIIKKIGTVDVVFCAGVLYHHPSPFDLLVALRQMCRKTLILRTSTIPEVDGLPNAAVYFPMLSEKDRALWNLKSLGVGKQVGITDGFEPDQGYGNWFWGMSPSCLISLVETAGFKVELQATEAFAQTLICTAVAAPFHHSLPDPIEAMNMGKTISDKGIAKPA